MQNFRRWVCGGVVVVIAKKGVQSTPVKSHPYMQGHDVLTVYLCLLPPNCFEGFFDTISDSGLEKATCPLLITSLML